MGTIKIGKEQFKDLIKRNIKSLLKENTALHLYNFPETEPLIEMARLNTNEAENDLFPFNKWEVKIWSNDHTPPHFHIICDGWDVSYLIENGEEIKINYEGKDKKILSYMRKNVKKWLTKQCIIMPKITNQENAQLIWLQIHN